MINLFKVNMPPNVDQKLKPILESGYISEGPVTKEFERQLQQWLGNPNTALVNSGTAALTIAARLAGLGPGTSCIASPMTCLAMPEAIASTGARIIFCDVDPFTGNLDPNKLEACIESDTKAVLFVDWAGTPANLDAINAIAHKHGLKTIEDAAHAFGATYKNKKVGNISDFTCFSFQAIKHLTTIDGGALACSSKEDYDRAVLLRWFGCKRGHNSSPIKWEGDVVEYGYKMHMNDVNATVGIESLKTIDSVINCHRENGLYLWDSIDNPNISKLDRDPGSAYWLFTIKCKDSAHRAEVSGKLLVADIANSIVHTRNDSYSLFKDSRKEMPGLDDFGSRMLNIPCGWWLTKDELKYIASTVNNL